MAGTNPSDPNFVKMIDAGIESIIYNAIHVNYGIINDGTIKHEFADKGHTNTPYELALRKMKMYGLIITHTFNKSENLYELTEKGWQFVSFEDEFKKARLPVEQMASVISTNSSVKSTNNIQKWLIGLATLFSALSLWISYLDYNKKDVINIRPPQVTILQSLPQSGIDTLSRDTL